MWPRFVEMALGAWLVASPFVLAPASQELSVNARVTGPVVLALAVLSSWKLTRLAHLAIVPVSLWLTAFGWLHSGEPAPAQAQNALLVGLLLFMFAIVPNHATLPPRTAVPREEGGPPAVLDPRRES